jgi:hypothetical protein
MCREAVATGLARDWTDALDDDLGRLHLADEIDEAHEIDLPLGLPAALDREGEHVLDPQASIYRQQCQRAIQAGIDASQLDQLSLDPAIVIVGSSATAHDTSVSGECYPARGLLPSMQPIWE